MARQQVVVLALVLLATVGLAFAADSPSPAAATKDGLPTFTGVPSAGPVPDNNDVGTVGGSGDGASKAPSPGGATDSIAAGSVGGPVSASAFGSIASGNAEGPKPSAATVAQLSAGVAVAAGVAASLLL